MARACEYKPSATIYLLPCIAHSRPVVSYLLPPANDCRVSHQPLPHQYLDPRPYTDPLLPAEQRRSPTSQGLPLRNHMPLYQTEDAMRKQIRADVQIPCVSRAQGQCLVRKAMVGNVRVCGGQDRALGEGEGRVRGWVVVRVVGSTKGGGSRRSSW